MRVADCIMVARGDLGIELPIQEVPMVQKRLLRLAGELARPSITATQMLDSMVRSARPTRAEVADVANAILDGTDAVMLSQETAVGAYPVEAIAMMASVARVHRARGSLPALERDARHARRARPELHRRPQRRRGRARARARRARSCRRCPGRSARLVSAHRPTVPIYALSPGKETVRRCGLMWGVRAASMRRHEVTEELIADAARRVVELGWCEPGQRVGITAGPAERAARAARACSRSSASATRATSAGCTATWASASAGSGSLTRSRSVAARRRAARSRRGRGGRTAPR